MEPWFNPNLSPILGVFFGGSGAAVSIMAGKLAPRGKSRRLVMGSLYAQLVISALLLILGVYAKSVGQPFGIWFLGIMLSGLINSVILTITTVKTARIYRQVGDRSVAAEAGM